MDGSDTNNTDKRRDEGMEMLKISLIQAVYHGNIDEVRMLLKSGADVNVGNSHVNPLVGVAIGGYLEIGKLLLDHGAKVISNMVIPLHMSIIEGKIEVARLFIGRGMNINTKDVDGDSPLILASCIGHCEIVDLLLSAGADVNIRGPHGETALILAVVNGHNEIAEMILQTERVQINAMDDSNLTALIYACKRGNMGIVTLLVNKYGANVDGYGDDTIRVSPLNAAISKGQRDVVQFLISKGANINKKDSIGFYPLIVALVSEQIEIAEALLEIEVDANVTIRSVTAISIAVSIEHVGIVKSLLKHGADPNIPDKDGVTPLSIAARVGNLEIVNLLLESGKVSNVCGKDSER